MRHKKRSTILDQGLGFRGLLRASHCIPNNANQLVRMLPLAVWGYPIDPKPLCCMDPAEVRNRVT